MKLRTLSILIVTAFALTGCTSMPSWLGGKKTDDTILPGTREEVLPPQKLPRGNAAATTSGGGTTSRQGALSGSDTITAPADCEPSNPNYPECLTPDAGDAPPVDEESAIPQQ
jgi:hypothetical protein